LTQTENRNLILEGVHNFRDYGGYQTSFGAVIPCGKLFRSGHLSNASLNDIDRLSAIALGVIVDLRSDLERKSDPTPDRLTTNAQIGFIPDTHGETPHLSSTFQGLTGRDEAIKGMNGIYAMLPFNPVNQRSFALHMTSLAHCHTPSLVHCFAGKDRTGITVALFHHLMGVTSDDVFHDYILTNAAGDERMHTGIAALRAKHRLKVSDEVLQEVMSVRPEYLDTAFSQMVSRYGSVDDYIRAGLGLSEEIIGVLRRNYST
jgi:protein-tyrosine phosphatase